MLTLYGTAIYTNINICIYIILHFIRNFIEEVKEIVKNKLIENSIINRSDSMDSAFNYDPLENDIFLDETTLSYPTNSNLGKILTEITVF